MAAAALAEHRKSWRAIGINPRPWGEVGVAKSGGLRIRKALDHPHRHSSHPATRMAFTGRNHPALSGGAAALVAFAAEVDVIGFHDRRPTVFERRSEEHTSELQSHVNLVCRLLLEKKKNKSKQQK